MERNEILTALNRIKNGTYARVSYKSEMRVKAEFKKQGVSIYRYTCSTFRTGVRYSNMASVIAERSAEDYVAPAPRANNDEWIIENKALHNTNTDKDYVYLIPLAKNAYARSYYVINANGVTFTIPELKDEYKEYLIPSELTPKKASKLRKINFENILSIANKRV